jgi:sortase A
MPNRTSGALHTWLSRALIVFGVACILFYATVTIQAAIYQRKAKAEIDRMISAHAALNEGPTSAAIGTPANIAKPLIPGELIGRVDVPRLNLSAAIAEGDDETTLGKAVGHLPDTPLPWHRRGNVALAAHRDGLFRALKDIRMGDEVIVVTSRGDYSYRVRGTHIVNPNDVWVVAPTVRPTVTLITCYPFSFVGHAPQRFVVQAELVGRVEGSVLKGAVLR